MRSPEKGWKNALSTPEAEPRPESDAIVQQEGSTQVPHDPPEQLDDKGPGPPPKRGIFGDMKPFVIVSSSYLLYTITDGAVRMIVLLHAYKLGFTALEVAIMFTLYEVAGVFTNLLAGIAGSRWGIRSTLLVGLVLQLVGIGSLFGWRDDWTKEKAIVFVTFSQMLCGVAKDLTKLGGKTVAKLVSPEKKETRLFKLVSFITGFKNSLKGAGYFLGAATVAVSYELALGILLALIILAIPWAVVGLETSLGRTKKAITLREVFQMNYNINVLSAARVFLFGSRDAWFEVPLPFFLRDDEFGLGWSRSLTGLVLACFIIVYGQVQSWSPQLFLGPLRQSPANKYVSLLWVAALAVLPAVLGPTILAADVFAERDIEGMAATLLAGISVFCVLFAVNSAVHSYLVLRYAEGDKTAVNVGFYYMSNAAGRLLGTIMSGVLYTYAGSNSAEGFGWCFVLSAAFLALCCGITVFIADDAEGLACGPCWTCVARSGDSDAGDGPGVEVALEREVGGEKGGVVETAAGGLEDGTRGGRSAAPDSDPRHGAVSPPGTRSGAVYVADELEAAEVVPNGPGISSLARPSPAPAHASLVART